MTLDILYDEYFEWMCKVVGNYKKRRRSSYKKLLKYLHDKEFIFTLEMDENRAEDGIDLRYRYAYDYRRSGPRVIECLDDGPCSILEMMVALAIRCEERIMEDPELGDRTSQWFWDMVENLGLASMDDNKFDEHNVEKIVDRFLNREYEENGEGGLFTVKNCRVDLRTVEIWYQMCWYLEDI